MLIAVIYDEQTPIATVPLMAKDFSSGSQGYHGNFRKAVIGGETHSGQIQVYRDGSKNDTDAPARAATVAVQRAERAETTLRAAQEAARKLLVKAGISVSPAKIKTGATLNGALVPPSGTPQAPRAAMVGKGMRAT